MKSLTSTALKVLETRYLRRDSLSRIIESPKDLFRRIAHVVAKAEAEWSSLDDVEYYENEYYAMMGNLEFLPNPIILMNAGAKNGQLSPCYVLPIPDHIEGITRAVQQMGVIHKSGGSTGFSFSSLRPKNDSVASTGGAASGPVSFLKVFDTATDVAKGGSLREVNIGVLRVDHPDILEFVEARREGWLPNFNLSVAVTSHFMRCLKKGTTYPLVNPRNEKIVKFIPARDVFFAICRAACETGNPGLLFIDEINRHNPTPQVGSIEATSPRGEQPLLPYESCSMGSINLASLVHQGEFDEERFEILIDLSVRFLDNVIDVNHYPMVEAAQINQANRKIGLGLMGFAEMLMKLGIPYDSPKARTYTTTMMKLFLKRCRQASMALAKQRGSFPNYKGSLLEKTRLGPLRNATLTTIAPTEILALIAGTTSGIEPVFALSHYRQISGGEKILEVEPTFLQKMHEAGIEESGIFEEISKTGSIQEIKPIPKAIKDLFKTTFDLKLTDHVKMQSIFQKYTDNAVSKTIYLPIEASWEDVYKIYMMAYELKCKGISAYPYGSQKKQILIDTGMKKHGTRTALDQIEKGFDTSAAVQS